MKEKGFVLGVAVGGAAFPLAWLLWRALLLVTHWGSHLLCVAVAAGAWRAISQQSTAATPPPASETGRPQRSRRDTKQLWSMALELARQTASQRLQATPRAQDHAWSPAGFFLKTKAVPQVSAGARRGWEEEWAEMAPSVRQVYTSHAADQVG